VVLRKVAGVENPPAIRQMQWAVLLLALLPTSLTFTSDDYDQLSTLQVVRALPDGEELEEPKVEKPEPTAEPPTAEPPKVEPPTAEPPKAEPPKAEALKAEVWPDKVKRFPGRKTLYPLPAAIQTHELAVVPYAHDNDTGVNVLVSQQSNSRLNFVHFPGDIGIATYTSSYVIGTDTSGLHGLSVSQVMKDILLVTLQFDSAVAWLDVSRGALHKPEVKKTAYIPLPAAGPHRTTEVGHDVWVTCKGIASVVRIKGAYKRIGGKHGRWNFSKGEDNFVTYLVKQNPVFVEGANGFIFATIDMNSAIVRINPNLGPDQPEAVTYFDVPADIGSTPVGMIKGYSNCYPGKAGGEVLWFVLAGGDGGGTGVFGKITGESRIHYFNTSAPFLSTAGYLHLAWAPCTGEGYPMLLLLASSTAYPSPPLRNPDGVATVSLDPDYSKILSQSFEFQPLQASMLHRIVASEHTYFVDGLKVSSLQATTTVKPGALKDSTVTDYFKLFGIGANGTFVKYDNPGCSVSSDEE